MFLEAGPSRKFDVRALRSRVRKAHSEEERLFDSSLLNDCIIFKGVPVGCSAFETADASEGPSMVVFLPFDVNRPGDGGSSFVFSQSADGTARCRRWLKQEKAEGSEMDLARLAVLNSVPSFSPAIVRLAFERASIPVPDCYASIGGNLQAELEEHLRARLRSMVVAAVGGSAATVEPAVAYFVEKLLSPDPTAQVAIAPLVHALQLPPKQGWDILASWVGFAIYECEMVALRSVMRVFVAWLHDAVPRERLCYDDKEMVKSMKRSILGRTRDAWNDLIGIERAYRDAHEAMAFKSNIRQFVSFIKVSPQYFARVGDVVGRIEQAIFIWKKYIARYNGEPLPYRDFSELCHILRHILVTSDSTYGFEVDGELVAAV
jgi:hypothetical protein